MNDPAWVRFPMGTVNVTSGDTIGVKFTATSTGRYDMVLMYDSDKVYVDPKVKIKPDDLRQAMLSSTPRITLATTPWVPITAGPPRPINDARAYMGLPPDIPNGDIDE